MFDVNLTLISLALSSIMIILGLENGIALSSLERLFYRPHLNEKTCRNFTSLSFFRHDSM